MSSSTNPASTKRSRDSSLSPTSAPPRKTPRASSSNNSIGMSDASSTVLFDSSSPNRPPHHQRNRTLSGPRPSIPALYDLDAAGVPIPSQTTGGAAMLGPTPISGNNTDVSDFRLPGSVNPCDTHLLRHPAGFEPATPSRVLLARRYNGNITPPPRMRDHWTHAPDAPSSRGASSTTLVGSDHGGVGSPGSPTRNRNQGRTSSAHGNTGKRAKRGMSSHIRRSGRMSRPSAHDSDEDMANAEADAAANNNDDPFTDRATPAPAPAPPPASATGLHDRSASASASASGSRYDNHHNADGTSPGPSTRPSTSHPTNPTHPAHPAHRLRRTSSTLQRAQEERERQVEEDGDDEDEDEGGNMMDIDTD